MNPQPLNRKEMYSQIFAVLNNIKGQSQSAMIINIIEKHQESAIKWLKSQFERNKNGSDNIFSNTFIEKKVDESFDTQYKEEVVIK